MGVLRRKKHFGLEFYRNTDNQVLKSRRNVEVKENGHFKP